MHKVTCLMPTYNRVSHPSRSVQESLECFLRQDCFVDNSGIDAELIIFNDCAGQTLSFDHPKVRVINVTERSSSLSDAFNRAASYGDGDLVTVWTDDDIRLPWTLSTSVVALGNGQADGYEYATIGPHFYSVRNHIVDVVRTAICQTAIVSRAFFDRLGGYRFNQEHDVDFDMRARSSGKCRDPLLLADDAGFLIYRWGDGHYHMSGQLSNYPGDLSQYLNQANRPVAPGVFLLEPTWRHDYVADAAFAVKKRK